MVMATSAQIVVSQKHSVVTLSIITLVKQNNTSKKHIGLDQYLSKKTYVRNWDHMKPEEKHTITIKGPRAAQIKQERIQEITEAVAQWRKANQIHNWFVQNVQNGEDNCKEYNVEQNQLEELLRVITEVLKSPGKAKNLLPNGEGFFFGNQEYDQYYFQELSETKKTLEALLKEQTDGEFYYQSSW